MLTEIRINIKIRDMIKKFWKFIEFKKLINQLNF